MKISQHSLILTEDKKILVCGGWKVNEETCLELQRSQWIQHSQLLSKRNYPLAVALSGKTYLLGGYKISGSELLATGTKVWQEGPDLENKK